MTRFRCAMSLLFGGLLLACIVARAQKSAEPEGGGHMPTHGKCAENDEPVGYPLKGWVGTTNTGISVSAMLIEARISRDAAVIATATTDSEGRFSLPTLKPGKYYLTGTLKVEGGVFRADDIVTAVVGKRTIACLVAEAEAPDQVPEK